MDVAVEVYYSALSPAGAVCAREEMPLRGGDPLLQVRARYAELFPEDGGRRTTIVDSASWHYDAASDRLVVTYLVHGKRLDVSGLPGAVTLDWDLMRSRNKLSTDPLAPNRSDLSALSIYRHAMRHLAFDVAHEPAVRRALAGDPNLAELATLDPAAAAMRFTTGRPRWNAASGQTHAPGVEVETFFTRINGADRSVSVARDLSGLPDGTDPTEFVRGEYSRIYPERDLAAKDTLLHSTSWRYDGRRNAIVLTYFIEACDLDVSRAGVPLTLPMKTAERDWQRRHPASGRAATALAHGLAHLAYLAERDPVVRDVLAREPAQLAAVQRVSATPSGELRAASVIA